MSSSLTVVEDMRGPVGEADTAAAVQAVLAALAEEVRAYTQDLHAANTRRAYCAA